MKTKIKNTTYFFVHVLPFSHKYYNIRAAYRIVWNNDNENIRALPSYYYLKNTPTTTAVNIHVYTKCCVYYTPQLLTL